VGSGWNPAATSPPRRDPHRPCQSRDPRYHRNAEHADWFRIATRIASDDAPEKPRRASPAPATPHEITPKTSNVGVDSRRIERVATPVAEQHVTARRRNRAPPGHGSCGSRPALSDHQPCSAASTQAPTPTVACATSGCTRPFTHMTSEPVMLPPPPRQEQRKRRWECAELHDTHDASGSG
jgi:hypothetical protein